MEYMAQSSGKESRGEYVRELIVAIVIMSLQRKDRKVERQCSVVPILDYSQDIYSRCTDADIATTSATGTTSQTGFVT
jgi:hypothetical protein